MVDSLELVKLTPLMELTRGRPEVKVGLIDGPIIMNHPYLSSENIQEIPSRSGTCVQTGSAACIHGTFVAGILSGRKNSVAPSICPACTLLVRPIFAETKQEGGLIPTTAPEELATAIIETIDAGVHVMNLSIALAQPSIRREHELEEALDYAAKADVIVVAASGNQGVIGSSAITRHPCVIPVVGCDLQGRPIGQSNIGSSIGRRGLCAPGDEITSTGTEGKSLTMGGTSVAAPFVTGTAALLLSAFPDSTGGEVRKALTQTSVRRTSVVPPLLNACAAYQLLAKIY